MPFATLPSSSGFTPPQAPNWAGFASQAIDLLAHRPILNLSGAVNQAVGQIDQILQLNSPMARMQRNLQMLQMQSQMETYRNYQQHPEQYHMTQYGPVLIDPVERMLKFGMYNKALADANKANADTGLATQKEKNIQTTGTWLDALRQHANPILGDPNAMSNLPMNAAPDNTVVPTTQPADDTSNTTPASSDSSSDLLNLSMLTPPGSI